MPILPEPRSPALPRVRLTCVDRHPPAHSPTHQTGLSRGVRSGVSQKIPCNNADDKGSLALRSSIRIFGSCLVFQLDLNYCIIAYIVASWTAAVVSSRCSAPFLCRRHQPWSSPAKSIKPGQSVSPSPPCEPSQLASPKCLSCLTQLLISLPSNFTPERRPTPVIAHAAQATLSFPSTSSLLTLSHSLPAVTRKRKEGHE